MDKKLTASHYIFLDESGNHGLKTINQQYPIFVLCATIFEKEYYEQEFIPQITNLKNKYFHDDSIILHSRDIRKWQKQFKALGDIYLRQKFYNDLDNLIKNSQFTIIASVIHKQNLLEKYGPRSSNPYDIALTFILERSIYYADKLSYFHGFSVFAESRGSKEDQQLLQQYQFIKSHGTYYINKAKFDRFFVDFDFVKKWDNYAGLQISDLVAYPIATKILYPERENLAFSVIENKLYRQFKNGDYLGYGIKIFP